MKSSVYVYNILRNDYFYVSRYFEVARDWMLMNFDM